MTSGVSWSVEGIDPSVRERAEAAARRAGLSLNDWLSSTLGEQAGQARAPAEVAEIHHRLDSISRQIEQMSHNAPPPRREGSGVAAQLNEAISRLDVRLSQLSAEPPRPARPSPAAPLRAETPPRPAPGPDESARQPAIPELLRFDVAEILARQSQLNAPPRAIKPPDAPPIAPQAPAPDLSGFERQLQYLTSQIEGLRRPDGIDQAIATFRSELGEMRQAIIEALPRRALESLETEIRALARRIDDSRQNGGDKEALEAIERALRDIYETLRTLTPAEQLAGFDDAIRNLGGKIDTIVRASPDPGAMQQLEGTIGALRGIVSNIASNEALARLSDDIRLLGSKVEQLTPSPEFAGSLAALEQRIALLTTNLENREPTIGAPNHLEQAVQALSDRIDHLQVGSDASSAFAHVEQRVLQLLERLEMADSRMANFGRVEEGLSDILRHLEQQRASLAALGEHRAPSLAPVAAPAMDPEVVDAIRRELSDLRLNRAESDRNTQDALESVHATLGHVVDRLASIEGDLRDSRVARAAAPEWSAAPSAFAASPSRAATPLVSSTAISAPMPAGARESQITTPRPDLPNPVATATAAEPRPSIATPPALKDILLGAAREDRGAGSSSPATMASRAPIDPSLPPDFPIEPGTRPQDRAAAAAASAPAPTASQRIAASEQALSEIPSPSREAVTSSNFIAAARRAAQAAANPPKNAAPDKPRHVNVLEARTRTAAAGTTAPGGWKFTSKIRSLLVGVSVVVIVLSGFKMAMTMLEGNEPPAPSERTIDLPREKSSDAAPAMTAPKAAEVASPAMTSPTPIQTPPADPTAATARPEPPAPKSGDITGTIPGPPSSFAAPAAAPAAAERIVPTPAAPATTFSPVSDTLPDAIGGAALRAAALRGDPTAAFEIGVRFADGRGVPVNYDESTKWFDRAADAGIVPAMFRLGTMYEKGLGGKKDVDAARRYYIRAAERGNAKAMHNLAVLDADGGNKGPNYKSAAEWFRKAAEHGVADSQFNLAILYARGMGVEQNLAESFKWFSLAAAQGDADAGRKRDDVAKRLDAQSLAAARLAIQTFAAEAQPSDAVTVATPTGGWDAAPPPTAAAPKPASKRAARMTTAAATARPATPAAH